MHATLIRNSNALKDGGLMSEQVLDLGDSSAERYEFVDKIVDIDRCDEGSWLRIQCEGLQEQSDFAWTRF